MSDHILGLRKARGAGWVTGVVHSRVRHGEAALELRGTAHHLTLRDALETLALPGRLNGHGGVASAFLGGTAGVDARDMILRDFLAEPGPTLEALRGIAGITRREWARRAGMSTRNIRRIVNEGTMPSLETARRLLEALQ